jgi:hypothetical protein
MKDKGFFKGFFNLWHELCRTGDEFHDIVKTHSKPTVKKGKVLERNRSFVWSDN